MTTYTVPVICCQCGEQYGEKDGFLIDEPTHGYCPDCHEKNMAEFAS